MLKTMAIDSNSMIENDKENIIMSHLLGIGVLLSFIVPHTSTAFLMVNPLLCLLYKCFRQNRIWYKGNFIVIIPLLLTILINLPQNITVKGALGGISMLLYFFCFPLVWKCKLPNNYLFITLFIVFFSQLIYLFRIPFLVELLNQLYPINEADYGIGNMQKTISSDNLLDFRLGGLYRNPNDCARSLTMMLAAYLSLNYTKSIKQLWVFIVISFIAVLLTGSRTGFAVSSIIILVYLYNSKSINKSLMLFLVVSLGGIFLYLLVNGSSQFRGVNVVQGLESSANPKLDVLRYYLSTENSMFRFLFGYLDNSRFDSHEVTMSYFDSDYGNIIFCYGFVGFFSILFFIVTIILKMNKNGRVFFVVLLWMISNSIISAYRTSFIFLLLLSTIYYQTKKNIS